MSIGVPIKLLHESEKHTITLETKGGEIYRGILIEAEDNMNCQMGNVTLTARDGRILTLEHVYIRGSQIRFFILPDMLKHAPMFKKVADSKKGSGVGSASVPSTVGRGRGRGGVMEGRGRGRAAFDRQ
eukprot:TRINITY_DN3968_c0_g1_i1.p1 TRINITY_DN3968_c0_g1~~TRINITY_DN3968_c0_g1_i1.p1  ORF type:complete len:128 (-),score=45.11 TRINITY_DN3968_c0_g1_i1:122-505(-)